MNAILPILLLLSSLGLFARVMVLTWDTATDMWEHAWHPAKLAVRVATLVLGLSFLTILGYSILHLLNLLRNL
jgi:hypothetical protein